ncbi:MAG: DUF177 domain-containing protein [Bacteroidota bacterium]
MNYEEQYEISFSGLKPGTHTFEFQIDKKFFEHIEYAEIRDGQVAVKITMDREERMMDFHFNIGGTVKVPCDRCNEIMDIGIAGEERLIVKLGDRFFEESDDVQIIPDTENKIDLGPFIYEYIYLLVPFRKVHPDDEKGNSLCDPEVIKKLNDLSEKHLPDPRWDVLNKLKNENS